MLFFCLQSAYGDVPAVSWLQEGGQSDAVCFRFQPLAPLSASPTAYTSSTQTSNGGGVRNAPGGAAFNILCHPPRWLWVYIRLKYQLLKLDFSLNGRGQRSVWILIPKARCTLCSVNGKLLCKPAPSKSLFCSCPVCSFSGVPLPPPGLPSHLHLLPPADARQTGRVQQRAGYRSTMWVVLVSPSEKR